MIIGIDPGQKGALCALLNGEPFVTAPLPMLQTGLDAAKFITYFDTSERDLVVVEQPIAMPRQSCKSTAAQFKLYGEILGACGALLVPVVIVRPQDWKASVFRGLDWKNKKTKPSANYPAGKPIKNKIAIDYVRRRFPSVRLRPTDRCTTDSLDMAESVCIALYGLTIAGGVI